MKGADKTITLFTHSLNENTGYDVWTGQVIRGVSVFGSTAVNVNTDGFASADVYTVRVPQKCGDFVFKAGDLIVLGEAEETTASPAELERKYQTLTVVGCTDNRGKPEPHWKVIGE